MHLRQVVVTQSDAVELLFVDALQECESLVVIAHGGTLESLQCQTFACQSRLAHTGCPMLSLAEVVEGRIVHKRLIVLVETEGQIVFLFSLTGLEVLASYLCYLTFVLSHNLWALFDDLIDLQKKRFIILLLSEHAGR